MYYVIRHMVAFCLSAIQWGRIADMGNNVPWILELDTTSRSTETCIRLFTTRQRTPGSNHIWFCVSEWAVLLYICSRKKNHYLGGESLTVEHSAARYFTNLFDNLKRAVKIMFSCYNPNKRSQMWHKTIQFKRIYLRKTIFESKYQSLCQHCTLYATDRAWISQKLNQN